MNGQVGAGICPLVDGKFSLKKSFRLSNDCSLFQAELVAIREAVRWVSTSPGVEKIRLYSERSRSCSIVCPGPISWFIIIGGRD